MAKWNFDMISRAEADRQTREAVAAALMEAESIVRPKLSPSGNGIVVAQLHRTADAIRALAADAPVTILAKWGARVRAEERERCARVAETEGVSPATNVNQPADSWYRHGRRIAAAIREGEA